MAITSDGFSIRLRNGVLSLIEGATGAALRLAKTQAQALAALGITLPLPVALGGTGNTGGAWTAYAPTITPNVTAGVTVTGGGAYRLVGKMLHLRLGLRIVYTDAPPTRLTIPLPAGLSLNDLQAGAATNHSGGLVLGVSAAGGANLTVFPGLTQLVTGSGQFLAVNLSGEVL